MRYLLALILLAGSALGATITNYTPTVMKVAVGAFYCNVYFHYPGNKWDYEAACYDAGGNNVYTQVNTAALTATHEEALQLPDGSIVAWLLVPTGQGTYMYQIQAQDPSSLTPTTVSGTL